MKLPLSVRKNYAHTGNNKFFLHRQVLMHIFSLILRHQILISHRMSFLEVLEDRGICLPLKSTGDRLYI